MDVQIIEAKYGTDTNGVDVKQHIINNYLKNNKLYFYITNDSMGGDPVVGKEKTLKLKLIWNDKEYIFDEPEGALINFPEQQYQQENCLVVTSCNRAEQICLAIAVNKEIIKNNFNIIIADGSTPHLNVVDGVAMHNGDDPYNSIKHENYNPNYDLIEQYIKTIPKIKNYRIIHTSPRLDKQTGEATLTSQGILAAANLGSKYAVKLTGVCHLKYDVFENIEQRMGESAVMTWGRTGFSPIKQRSTRVFAVRPDVYMSMLSKESYYGWIRCYDWIERRFAKLNKINKNIVNPIDLPLDERDIIADGGFLHNIRSFLMENLKTHNLINSSDPWIRKFLNGHIWSENNNW